MLRVFHDRLTDDADREWLVALVKEKTEMHFRLKFDALLGRLAAPDGSVSGQELRHLMFCDYMVPGADPQQYDEVLDEPELFATVTGYLADYNGM